MPGRHPDDDLLADLAADVLPADQARAVEAHVLGCDRCTRLLEDAERVRSLLLSDDPGPVPADVWQRIEAALTTEASAAQRAHQGRDHTGDTAAFRGFVDTPTGSHRVAPVPASPDAQSYDVPSRDAGSPGASDADSAGWTDADPLDDPVRWGGRPVPSGRSGTGGSRRDARTDLHRRRGPLLLAAAAVLAVVAVTGSVKLLGRSGPSEASGSAGAAQGAPSASADAGSGAGAGASRAPIVRSGRDYRATTLAAQASALLGRTAGVAGAATGGAAGSVPSPEAAAPGVSRLPEAAVPPDTAADDITNPSRLTACLDTLGVAGERLVAVDLATYEGREAAILVLTRADGSGHEVWAVERTCAPGAEGALKYTRLSE
jgi:hypothetical protein